MSNSKNSKLEDVSKGNDESAPGANDSTSNKKTRFTKSKSISEVFHELEFEDEPSVEFDESSVDEIIPIHNEEDESSDDDFMYIEDEEEEDEIIPIHNEYRDLDKSEASVEESDEGGIIINPDLEDLAEENVKESNEYDSIENTDSIGGEADSSESLEDKYSKYNFDESSESIDGTEEIDDDAFITQRTSDDALADEDAFIIERNSDNVVADEDIEEKIGKSSAQGVLINDKDKTSDSKKSFDIFDRSSIISIVSFIVGLAILLIGITYYASSSDRVVDNVLSGETAGLAILLAIIGLIIMGFSLLNFFSSSKSSLIIDTFNSIKSIDYDDFYEDAISREDFDAVFSIFKRKKDSDFSDDENGKSVDSSKDLSEKDQDEVSDDDISSLYSKSNLTSQKNQSSSKGQETANSTESSQDYDDGVDEIIPIHSKLNKQSDDGLEDNYSEYDSDDLVDDYDLDDGDYVEEDSPEDFDLEDNQEEEAFEETLEDVADSSLEADKMDGLEDKYAKYDFGEDSDDEIEESVDSKPKFKKSVDLSKYEEEPLTEEELAEKKRKAEELEEKKRRIIEGTNFDNSLRKN